MTTFWPDQCLTEKHAHRQTTHERRLELYAFLVAEQVIDLADKAVQDRLIQCLYTLGKRPTLKSDY